MTDDTLALAFKALSHPRRARIFRVLAETPEQGRSFSRLRDAVKISDTPLVHHLREMERCGLVRRVRRGPEVAHILTPGPLERAMAAAQVLAGSVGARARTAA